MSLIFSKFKRKSGLLFIVILSLASCTDPIMIDLESGKGQLCVDAMLTNDSSATPTIKLRITDNYFKQGLPPALGATVTIKDLASREFTFTDPDNDGNYVLDPALTNNGPYGIVAPFGIMGDGYFLNIKYSGEEFESFAYMDSVPKIDSLYYDFLEQQIQGPDTVKEGYMLNMVAKDLPGEGNCYWFKSYKNHKFFNKPGQMNLSYDAAFGPGSDGVQFIIPIIYNLTPQRFHLGDSATVEIYSIGQATYYFMSLAQAQMTNEGLFATPPSNVPTNIINKNKDSEVKAVGWFAAAGLSRKSVIIK